ncbi:MAG: hypothetical protein ACR2JF_05305 [Iamia sp.]
MAVKGPGFPVPVFPASAVDTWGDVQELRARPEVRLVPTPRHASVLLVAGSIPPEHREAVDRVHDQLPHPRATVWWRTDPDAPTRAGRTVEGGPDEVVEAIIAAHLAVAVDPEASEPDRRPDEEAHEWRGVGPNGQGGEGMMGGTPYGRPMAMTGDDRDGLALDQLHLRLGPFLDALPAGMVLDVTLQGDVLQQVAATRPGAPVAAGTTVAPGRQGLHGLAHGLHVQGLEGLAARAAGLALDCGRGREVGPDLVRLRRGIRRSGLLWMLKGTGVSGQVGDAADRWAHRLDRVEAAVGGGAPPESTVLDLDDLGPLLEGRTLGDAITTLVSLDLDLDLVAQGVPR